MFDICRQVERIDDTDEKRNCIICGIARRYADNIINHFGGFKNEDEFARIYHHKVPRAIYAGY